MPTELTHHRSFTLTSLVLVMLVMFILPIWQSAKLGDYRQSKLATWLIYFTKPSTLMSIERGYTHCQLRASRLNEHGIGLRFYQRTSHLFPSNTKCLAQLGRVITPKRPSPGKPMSLGEMKMLSNNCTNPSYPRYDR